MKYNEYINKTYEKNTKEIASIIKGKNTKTIISEDNDKSELSILSENKEKILSGEYMIIGFYDVESSIFFWGDKISPKNKALFFNNKKQIKKIEKKIIKKKYDDVEFMEVLRYCVKNNTFYINNDDLMMMLKYCCVVSKSIGLVYEILHKDKKKYIVSYLISKITQF
jgi:hypothetical protein